MADITPDVGAWSSTAGSNQPQGTTSIGTGLDDNLRAIEAGVKSLAESLSGVSGTNTITATMANLTAYYSGLRVLLIPANNNSGATTLEIGSLGAKNVFFNNAACVGGEIKQSVPVELVYDGTQFQIPVDPPASDTVAGRIEIAVQSEMETGSSTTLAVTPGRQHFHPSAAKAWGYVNGGGSLLAGYNCSAAKNSTGDYTITFTTAISSADYAVVVTGTNVGGTGSTLFGVSSPLAGSFHVLSTGASFNTLADAPFYFAVFGDL